MLAVADTSDLQRFLDASPSPFHAVAEAARRLGEAGYAEIDERTAATAERGYVIRDGSIVAWAGVDAGSDDGVRIIGAHTDSPNLRVKPRPDLARVGTRQLALEPYGGLLLSSWLNRDLGLAGRVGLRDGSIRLVRSDGPALQLPQLAIHLDREVNTKGLIVDPQRHTAPIFGLGPVAEGDFAGWVAQQAGVGESPEDVVAWDVMTFDVTAAARVGRDEELLASGRLDNQCSCWAAIDALIDRGRGIVALWDHEEIGSGSNRGAGSPLLDAVLERLLPDPARRRRVLAGSVCASSDMAHATHPNFVDRHEPNHLIALGGGPVLKTNVNERYATDARSAPVFAAACEDAGVPVQWYAHRADIPCGSTIGPITAARLGVTVVDIGAPMLSMHSAREVMAAADALALRDALASFLVTTS